MLRETKIFLVIDCLMALSEYLLKAATGSCQRYVRKTVVTASAATHGSIVTCGLRGQS